MRITKIEYGNTYAQNNAKLSNKAISSPQLAQANSQISFGGTGTTSLPRKILHFIGKMFLGIGAVVTVLFGAAFINAFVNHHNASSNKPTTKVTDTVDKNKATTKSAETKQAPAEKKLSKEEWYKQITQAANECVKAGAKNPKELDKALEEKYPKLFKYAEDPEYKKYFNEQMKAEAKQKIQKESAEAQKDAQIKAQQAKDQQEQLQNQIKMQMMIQQVQDQADRQREMQEEADFQREERDWQEIQAQDKRNQRDLENYKQMLKLINHN